MNIKEINELFYAKDGKLFNKIRRGRRGLKDAEVGTLSTEGYLVFGYMKRKYQVHRILFQIYHQIEEIIGEVDHLDCDRTNNHQYNLRISTKSQNQCNAKVRKNNKLGIKGICVEKLHGKYYYRAYITCNGKNSKKMFEYNDDGLSLAKKWIEDKRKELHGAFANNG